MARLALAVATCCLFAGSVFGAKPRVEPAYHSKTPTYCDHDSTDEPDPQDRPQPRISLIDIAGDAPPRFLVAPHSFAGALAFSRDGRTLAFGGSGAIHLFYLGR